MHSSNPNLVLGVGAVVWNANGQVLLVRRARPPRAGEWSIPGGKVETGESLHTALERELLEETGIEIEIGALAGVSELFEDNRHYVLVDFTAHCRSGALLAASDALEARWVTLTEIDHYQLWPETKRIIAKSARDKSANSPKKNS